MGFLHIFTYVKKWCVIMTSWQIHIISSKIKYIYIININQIKAKKINFYFVRDEESI